MAPSCASRRTSGYNKTALRTGKTGVASLFFYNTLQPAYIYHVRGNPPLFHPFIGAAVLWCQFSCTPNAEILARPVIHGRW